MPHTRSSITSRIRCRGRHRRSTSPRAGGDGREACRIACTGTGHPPRDTPQKIGSHLAVPWAPHTPTPASPGAIFFWNPAVSGRIFFLEIPGYPPRCGVWRLLAHKPMSPMPGFRARAGRMRSAGSFRSPTSRPGLIGVAYVAHGTRSASRGSVSVPDKPGIDPAQQKSPAQSRASFDMEAEGRLVPATPGAGRCETRAPGTMREIGREG